MIDINLIPETVSDPVQEARWPTVAFALGGVLLAVLVIANAYFALSVIPGLELRIAERESAVNERAGAVAALTREKAALAARQAWVDAAKGMYAHKPLWTAILAQIQNAIAAADETLAGEGMVWLSEIDAGNGTLSLHGFVTGPGTEKAVQAIADSLTAAGTSAVVEALEPMDVDRQQFEIRAAVQP